MISVSSHLLLDRKFLKTTWHDDMIFFHVRICTSNVVQRSTDTSPQNYPQSYIPHPSLGLVILTFGLVWWFAVGQSNTMENETFASQIVSTFEPAASCVSISARNTAAVWRIRKSWAAWPASLTPRHHRGKCWPVNISVFIPPLPKQFCRVNKKCTVTYLRWLAGQITADVTHPDISEGSLRLALAAAPLPSCMYAMYSLHAAAVAHMLHFWWLGISWLLFQSTPPVVSSPPRFDLSAECSTF